MGSGDAPTRLQLLDGFAVVARGVDVPLPFGAQRLLAYVALHQPRLRRIAVAEALWPDRPSTRAAACLRSTLWRLRTTGVEALTVDGELLSLRAAIAVDVHDLERRVARLRDPAVESTSDDLDVTGLRGELLPGWLADEWTIMERERLRQIRLHGMDALAARLLRLGRHGEAIEVGMEAVRDEPLRESAHRVVVRAHLAEGNASEALRHHDWYAEMLRDELGIAPSPAFARLLAGLRA